MGWEHYGYSSMDCFQYKWHDPGIQVGQKTLFSGIAILILRIFIFVRLRRRQPRNITASPAGW